mmetsp:Transcript_3787/g.3944  ORF Transcript_3787/g.3944 Transcript_3787/m.3944 type:complete len:129 (+) Transcript_3787:1297-1683(+)
MFIEGVVIVVDAKWWSPIVGTESTCCSDIPDTICDRRVDGLGGVSFVGIALLSIWLSTNLDVFHRPDKDLGNMFVSNYVVSYHVEVSREPLNAGSPSMPAKSPVPFTGMFFGPESFGFSLFYPAWTNW